MNSCNPKNLNGSNFSDPCQYVKSVNACYFESGFLNYFEWQYCGFDNRWAPTILMFCWFLVLLMGVATTADSFFAPCLVVVTKILRMSQNLAGVTLLALGNGAADVFSCISAVISSNDPNIGLALGSILGAGILVNTITAGVIMIICPFDVMRRPIIKDLMFYLVALLWCMIILIRKKIELWSSLVFLSLYIIYVFVTAISRALYIKYKNHRMEDIPRESMEVTVTNKTIFDNERNMGPINERPHKNVDIISQMNLGHDNPTYINENIGNFLNVPQLHQFGNHRCCGQSISAGTSAIDVGTSLSHFTKKRVYNSLNLNTMKSTSHRSIGSFAKIIIKNEHEREILKNNLKIRISKSFMRRTVSLTALSEISAPRIKIRFYSASSFPGLQNESSTVCKRSCNRMKENIIQDNAIESLQSQTNEANLNEILQFSARNSSCSVTFPGAFKHFLLTIFPVELEDWSGHSMFKKIVSVVQSPIMFILTITIPVVEEGVYLKGWCKILNCIHCLFSPLIWITFIHVNMNPIGTEGFIVTYLILIIGLLVAIAVAITSEANRPPIYHPFFAFLGFITSIFWIYEIVNEIVNVLTTLGVVLSIPQTILGLSVLAFANSVGDLVSNITLARKNYPRIAYAACIGGPLFNLLVGIGLPFSIKTAQKPILINLKSETVVLMFTIILVTVMNIFALPLMKFHVRRCYGKLLITIYFVFFILVILFAANVIKVTF